MHSREQSSRGMPPPPDDELVPLSRLARELGISEFKVRNALNDAGDRVIFYPKQAGETIDRRVKLYPLRYTLQLLEEPTQSELPADVASDRRVAFQQIVSELGWAPNTVRKYMASLRRSLFTFPGEGRDSRKRLYPLQHTLRLIRREHTRTQARRERGKDEAAGYWTALAQLKVARAGLKRLRLEAERLESEVDAAFRKIRRRPPRSEVDIHTLPDRGLELRFPLCAVVAPLRWVHWKATVPEIPLRGEGREPEDAIVDLRQKLASTFRQLQEEPGLNPGLLESLSEFIRERRHRRTHEEMARDTEGTTVVGIEVGAGDLEEPNHGEHLP
jgi:hypothetical protein